MMDDSGWIPVEKALPTKGEIVLITIHTEEDEFFNAADDVETTLYNDEWIFSAYSNFTNESKSKVVAWMPLPKPYRKGE